MTTNNANVHPYLTRASQLGDVAGDALGGAIVSVAGLFSARRPAAVVRADNFRGVVPYQGPLPAHATKLYQEALGAVGVEEDAKPAVNAIVAARNEQHGYNADAKNFGGLRCLVAHEHGTDSQCVKCTTEDGSTTFLRCHGSDREALERLVRVARASTLTAPVAPLCPKCGEHDADPAPAIIEPGSQPLPTGAPSAPSRASATQATVTHDHADEDAGAASEASVTHDHADDEAVGNDGKDDLGGGFEGLVFRVAPRANLGAVLTPAQRQSVWPPVMLLQAGKLSRGQMEQLVDLGAITPVPRGVYKPTRFALQNGKAVVVERASVRSPDDLGGWMGAGLAASVAATFVALAIAAGAAKVEANRLVKGLREKGIEIVPPGKDAPAGMTVINAGFEREQSADFAQVRAVFVAVLGSMLGERVLKFAVSRGWRYAKLDTAAMKQAKVAGYENPGDALRYITGQRSHKGHDDPLRYVTGQRGARLNGADCEGLGFGEDLEAAWNICKWCKKLGAAIGNVESRSDGKSAAVKAATAGNAPKTDSMQITFSGTDVEGLTPSDDDIAELGRIAAAIESEAGLAGMATIVGGVALDAGIDLDDLGWANDDVGGVEITPEGIRHLDHVGGYRSLAKDFKAVASPPEEDRVDDGLDGVLGGGVGGVSYVGEGIGAATPVTQWVPDASGKLVKQTGIPAMATPDDARKQAVVAYLQARPQNADDGPITLGNIYDRLLKAGYLFALPGELILNGTVITPEQDPNLRSLLLRIRVQPDKGRPDLGDAKLWIAHASTDGANLGGVGDVGRGTPPAVAPKANAKNADFILDVRTEKEFDEKHLEGALNVPVDDLGGRVGEILDLANGRRIVVFCAGGMRAARAVYLLRERGANACSGHKDPTCGCTPGGITAVNQAPQNLVPPPAASEGLTLPMGLLATVSGVDAEFLEDDGIGVAGGVVIAAVGVIVAGLIGAKIFTKREEGKVAELIKRIRAAGLDAAAPGQAIPAGWKNVDPNDKRVVVLRQSFSAEENERLTHALERGLVIYEQQTAKTSGVGQAVEAKVLEVAAAWAELKPEVDKLDGAFGTMLKGYFDRWLAWWNQLLHGKATPPPVVSGVDAERQADLLDGLAGVVLDLNLVRETLAEIEAERAAPRQRDDLSGADAAQTTRIANIHAILKTHNEAVEKSKDKLADEPEFKEYAARWKAFVDEMNKLGEKAQSILPWIGADDDIQSAENRLNMLVKEWDSVGMRIQLRKQSKVNEQLEATVKAIKDKALAAQEQGKATADATPQEKADAAKLNETVRKAIDATKPEQAKTAATTPTPGGGSVPRDDKGKGAEENPSALTWMGIGAGALLAAKLVLGRIF